MTQIVRLILDKQDHQCYIDILEGQKEEFKDQVDARFGTYLEKT
jgi:hypothetical protein